MASTSSVVISPAKISSLASVIDVLPLILRQAQDEDQESTAKNNLMLSLSKHEMR
jgi:hypothetical protein